MVLVAVVFPCLLVVLQHNLWDRGGIVEDFPQRLQQRRMLLLPEGLLLALRLLLGMKGTGGGDNAAAAAAAVHVELDQGKE